MPRTLKLALWNANGLFQHEQEVQSFLSEHQIDIMLISETHNTKKSFIKIPRYTIYNTIHPDGTAHGGTAIIIKSIIKHHEIEKYEKDYLQATTVVVEDWLGPLTISAIYCPPKHTIKMEQFDDFYNSLGNRFIAGGDYNAKHQQWGSRLATTRGRELLKAIQKGNLHHISTSEPTHWPTDRRKIPDVIDFCVTKGIASNYFNAKSCLDLSSDHSPVLLTLGTQLVNKQKPPKLYNNQTDWHLFRYEISMQINQNIKLKTESDIDQAVEHLNQCIQQAAWKSTPERNGKYREESSKEVMYMVKKKRRLRQQWQRYRLVEDKRKLNKAIKQLKQLLCKIKNQSIQEYLSQLSATENTDYSLWKATRYLKQPLQHNPPIRKNDGYWARSNAEKAELFAEHLEKVFQPYPSEITEQEDRSILTSLDSPSQMDLTIKKFSFTEIKTTIHSELNPKKAPGYDLVTGKVLQELPDVGIRLLTYIFNAILRTGYFPIQWKISQVILIPKPGKPQEEVASYRPISLLPCMSKLFEKMLLKRLKPILLEKKLIPDHQFGFRAEHSTIEQVHRIVKVIQEALEEKKYCSALFMDIAQAFDKVWHVGLQYKIKQLFPQDFYRILKSYLSERFCIIKYQDAYSTIRPIKAGIPQGSVLGPILYLIYTADLPTSNQVTVATFADDTAILSSHENPIKATEVLQQHINTTQIWMKKWRIKANEAKSNHVTFTMRRGSCPPIKLNNQQIPQSNDVKYLGIHLDERLTWRKHIWSKRKQLGIKLSKMYWLICKKSALSIQNKLLLYKAILKPIWSYGIQLWGTASNSNLDILQRFQSKYLRIIVDAPWYVTNDIIQRDLNVATIREEIRNSSTRYQSRLTTHPNVLANKLSVDVTRKRLKRHKIVDLPNRF